MLSEEITRRFVQQITERDAKFIAAKQLQVVQDWDLFNKTDPEHRGTLENSLKQHFNIEPIGGGARLTMRYLAYARFLDISLKAKRQGFYIYNKIVFGVLYNRTMMGLKYGFTEEVKNEIIAEIEQLAIDNPDLKIKT